MGAALRAPAGPASGDGMAGLVDPELLAFWFPTGVVGAIEPGASLTFPDEVLPEPMTGSVLELSEPHLLALVWGDDVLRFELEEVGEGTSSTRRTGLAGWPALG